MTILILALASLILITGVAVVINPLPVFGFLAARTERWGFFLFAVFMRLLMGIALVVAADDSRFPLVIEILGWLATAGALILAIIGRRNFSRVLTWALSLAGNLGRFAGLLAIAFSGFLIYAFI